MSPEWQARTTWQCLHVGNDAGNPGDLREGAEV
jgi:hypothetical protein